MSVIELKSQAFDLVREAEQAKIRILAEQEKIKELQGQLNTIVSQIEEAEKADDKV